MPTVSGHDESRIATGTSTYGAFDKGWFSPANLAAAMTPTRGCTTLAKGVYLLRFTAGTHTVTQHGVVA